MTTATKPLTKKDVKPARRTSDEEKSVIDVNVLLEAETEKSSRLEALIRARVELAAEEKEIKKRKDAASKEIKELLESLEADVIILDGDGFELQQGKGAGKWNLDVAAALLTPDVLSKIYTPGSPNVRLMPLRSEKVVDELRASLS